MEFYELPIIFLFGMYAYYYPDFVTFLLFSLAIFTFINRQLAINANAITIDTIAMNMINNID